MASTTSGTSTSAKPTRIEGAHFFASRLKWSRFVRATLVSDEREETLVRALLNALAMFCGVPLGTVWDNSRTVVLTREGERIVRNPVFGQVALHYRFAPGGLAARRPQMRSSA